MSAFEVYTNKPALLWKNSLEVRLAQMALDAIKRLTDHNSGKNRFTKGHRPWKIIYSEPHPDWATARIREKYFKTAAGKNWLRKMLNKGGDIPLGSRYNFTQRRKGCKEFSLSVLLFSA